MALDFGIPHSAYQFGMFSNTRTYREKRKHMVSTKAYFSEFKSTHLSRTADFSGNEMSGILQPHDDLSALIHDLPDTFSKESRDGKCIST